MEGKPLLDVLRGLILDRGEQDDFAADPSGYMQRFGYDDVQEDDMAEAIGLVADTLPPGVAHAVTTAVDDPGTGGEGTVGLLERLSTVDADAAGDIDGLLPDAGVPGLDPAGLPDVDDLDDLDDLDPSGLGPDEPGATSFGDDLDDDADPPDADADPSADPGPDPDPDPGDDGAADVTFDDDPAGALDGFGEGSAPDDLGDLGHLGDLEGLDQVDGTALDGLDAGDLDAGPADAPGPDDLDGLADPADVDDLEDGIADVDDVGDLDDLDDVAPGDDPAAGDDIGLF